MATEIPLELPFTAASIKLELGPPGPDLRQFRIVLVDDEGAEIADPTVQFDVELVSVNDPWNPPFELEVGGLPQSVVVDPMFAGDGAHSTAEAGTRVLFSTNNAGAAVGAILATSQQGGGDTSAQMVIRLVRSRHPSVALAAHYYATDVVFGVEPNPAG